MRHARASRVVTSGLATRERTASSRAPSRRATRRRNAVRTSRRSYVTPGLAGTTSGRPATSTTRASVGAPVAPTERASSRSRSLSSRAGTRRPSRARSARAGAYSRGVSRTRARPKPSVTGADTAGLANRSTARRTSPASMAGVTGSSTSSASASGVRKASVTARAARSRSRARPSRGSVVTIRSPAKRTEPSRGARSTSAAIVSRARPRAALVDVHDRVQRVAAGVLVPQPGGTQAVVPARLRDGGDRVQPQAEPGRGQRPGPGLALDADGHRLADPLGQPRAQHRASGVRPPTSTPATVVPRAVPRAVAYAARSRAEQDRPTGTTRSSPLALGLTASSSHGDPGPGRRRRRRRRGRTTTSTTEDDAPAGLLARRRGGGGSHGVIVA